MNDQLSKKQTVDINQNTIVSFHLCSLIIYEYFFVSRKIEIRWVDE